jgi:hypothetical protein
MKAYIEKMHAKDKAKAIPESYDYRIKSGINSHSIHPTEVPNVKK